MKNRIISLALIIVIVLGLCSCGGGGPKGSNVKDYAGYYVCAVR